MTRRMPGGVGGHRLFREDVLAGLHGGFEVNRAEARRRGENDQVDARVDRLLIGVEADELLVFGHVDPIFVFLHQLRQAAVEPIGERIGHGHELHGAARAERLTAGAGAAAAATDQGHFDRIVVGAAWAMRAKPSVPARVPPAATIDDVLMNSRREGVTIGEAFAWEDDSFIGDSPNA